MPNPTIILCTLNAKYIHTAFGLRCLYANLAEFQAHTQVLEFTLKQRPLDIVEQILQQQPTLVGFGVYIWNVEALTQVVQLLKRLRPELTLVLGGPEVSYEIDTQPICQLADYIITGEGESTFYQLCRDLHSGNGLSNIMGKILPGSPPDLAALQLPYETYDQADIEHRIIYLEASRGCPFRCEFCLSSLDKKVRQFPMAPFLAALTRLYDRGVRQFKFVDRTFNLKVPQCLSILGFFLARVDRGLFVHFEVIPDRLPEALKTTIQQFPAGTLQFEIGIQTFNPEVQQNISRRQDTRKTLDNIHWLMTQSQAHLHTDLIIGLPGETYDSFGAGLDLLIAVNPHEIQVGILKRLRGTPIIRHTDSHEMIFSPHPPYDILCHKMMDFDTLQRLRRFARYWDMIGNSGRFKHTRRLLTAEQPFQRFMLLSDWLFARTGQTHAIALKRLFELVYAGLIDALAVTPETAKTAILADHAGSKLCNKRLQLDPEQAPPKSGEKTHTPHRQARFLG